MINEKNYNYISYILSLDSSLFIMLICYDTTKDGKIIINERKVEKIEITTLPGYVTKIIQNENEVDKVVNYINELDLKKTSKDAGQYEGMTYIITVYYKDGTSKEYVHFGNIFFKEMGKTWYEISYKQAEKFETIYKNLNRK